jgi:hypothetical protein
MRPIAKPHSLNSTLWGNGFNLKGQIEIIQIPLVS